MVLVFKSLQTKHCPYLIVYQNIFRFDVFNSGEFLSIFANLIVLSSTASSLMLTADFSCSFIANLHHNCNDFLCFIAQ